MGPTVPRRATHRTPWSGSCRGTEERPKPQTLNPIPASPVLEAMLKEAIEVFVVDAHLRFQDVGFRV